MTNGFMIDLKWQMHLWQVHCTDGLMTDDIDTLCKDAFMKDTSMCGWIYGMVYNEWI
jgi:hypothetical protein